MKIGINIIIKIVTRLGWENYRIIIINYNNNRSRRIEIIIIIRVMLDRKGG